ncbi:MAG: pteridine-dependent deoxygenase [Rhodanobacteraceae bacterium]
MNATRLARFAVQYQGGANELLEASGTLALLGFGEAAIREDPRALRVPLSAPGAAPRELWWVDAEVDCGREGSLHWSAGGGWLFAALDVHESEHGGIEAASEFAYGTLCGFVAARAEHHLLRLWNYLHAINEGEGDAERYRQFCIGRGRGLAAHGIHSYPAATAIGHRDTPGLLQLYALCATRPGEALENPRQVSAWRYPRQYGPTPPSFARALKLPNGDLAISGTAAVVGHASQHGADVAAQVRETCINLRALLDTLGVRDFDATSPLKVYVRDPEDAPVIESVLADRLDASVPRVLLVGDICRRELLVEVDGWHLAPR